MAMTGEPSLSTPGGTQSMTIVGVDSGD